MTVEEAKKRLDEAEAAEREEGEAVWRARVVLREAEEAERAKTFIPNATMTRPYFEAFHMNTEKATPALREGERVHVEMASTDWDDATITRADGRQFRLHPIVVKMDGA